MTPGGQLEVERGRVLVGLVGLGTDAVADFDDVDGRCQKRRVRIHVRLQSRSRNSSRLPGVPDGPDEDAPGRPLRRCG